MTNLERLERSLGRQIVGVECHHPRLLCDKRPPPLNQQRVLDRDRDSQHPWQVLDSIHPCHAERGHILYKQGKIPGSFYDGRGQEAIPVGSSWALAPEDRMCILHRDLGAHFVRGVTPDRYLAMSSLSSASVSIYVVWMESL